MKPELKQFTATVGGQTITFETGQLAMQAGGAVTVRLDGSLILATATMSDEPREGINFFPLSVDYEERMYAGGRIPGGFFRREGRPTENAILTARLTDRPLRPLFPKDMRNDVQVIMYAISADPENPLDVIAINAASAAVMISDAPWNGPVAAVRIGLIDGEFVVNPSYAELEQSDLDLRIAGTRDALLMVEAGASEVDEDTMTRALTYAHEKGPHGTLRPSVVWVTRGGRVKVHDFGIGHGTQSAVLHGRICLPERFRVAGVLVAGIRSRRAGTACGKRNSIGAAAIGAIKAEHGAAHQPRGRAGVAGLTTP